MKTLYIVVPSYNEQAVLDETAKRLGLKLNSLVKAKKISNRSRVIFIDDGSKDDTWNIVQKINSNNKMFGGIKLSRNRGHQNALLAGLLSVKSKADVVVSMDADLQDDIDAIDEMLEKFYGGAEIVYGVRNSRQKDSFFKRNTALLFYRLMSRLGVDSVYNHADYRLMSARAIEELSNFKEVNLFLRGMVPLIGFKTAIVEYKRSERFAGKSKYSLRKMLSFAIDGITSFSVKPLRVIGIIGLVVSVMAVFMLVYSLAQYALGNTVDGWTFTVASIWLLGGIQVLALGVIGEYIGKIYSEVKARPRFIIEEDL